MMGLNGSGMSRSAPGTAWSSELKLIYKLSSSLLVVSANIIRHAAGRTAHTGQLTRMRRSTPEEEQSR